MVKHLYRHLGYYNDVEDIEYIKGKTADEIVDYMHKNCGHFYLTPTHEIDCDIVLEEEDKNEILITNDKTYIVATDGTFIDIYKLYALEEDGQIYNNVERLYYKFNPLKKN